MLELKATRLIVVYVHLEWVCCISMMFQRNYLAEVWTPFPHCLQVHEMPTDEQLVENSRLLGPPKVDSSTFHLLCTVNSSSLAPKISGILSFLLSQMFGSCSFNNCSIQLQISPALLHTSYYEQFKDIEVWFQAESLHSSTVAYLLELYIWVFWLNYTNWCYLPWF